MKIIAAIPLLFLLVIQNGCISQDEQRIKKDLDSRFTKFEIVEIRVDNSNLENAWNLLLSCRLNVSDNNLKISKALLDYEVRTSNYPIPGIKISEEERKTWAKKRYFEYLDSVYKVLEAKLLNFEDLKFSKKYREKCFYVKYRLYKEENKIEKEEYYFLKNNNNEIVHRPYKWDDFLIEENYSDPINSALEYYSEILKLKY
jgi:hypothetical protein